MNERVRVLEGVRLTETLDQDRSLTAARSSLRTVALCTAVSELTYASGVLG